jgi:MSHA biogenesis protein MshJ
MLNNLLAQFSTLTNREKQLFGVTVFIGLSSSWYAFFCMPLMKEQADLKQQLATTTIQIAAQQQAAVQLQNRHDMDDKKNQLAALKADYQQLQTQTQALNNTFVPPALMANVLSDLLKQNKQLTLNKLETLPVKQQQLLYQHGLELHFSGSYTDTLAYLTALEAMSWNFVWDSINYQVKDYPIAEITLRVHTLSLEKSWLDV